ncbi:MAG: ATP-grasp domain-containing protein [Chloroflexota bacterium]
MPQTITVVYNQPRISRYHDLGEGKAEFGILDAVFALEKSLQELGYEVTCLPLRPPLARALVELGKIKSELIFNLFEGFSETSDSEAQVTLKVAEIGLPYTGSPGSAIALAQDKLKALSLLDGVGIRVPVSQLLSPEEVTQFKLAFPCLVKPIGEHASHGLSRESVVKDIPSLLRQVERVSRRYGGKALVQEYLEGREFNATVIGNRDLTVLPISEIVFLLPPGLPKILTFTAKWQTDSAYYKGTKPVCPAELSGEEAEQIRQTVLAVFRLFGCRGYARVDLRQGGDGAFRVIDVNPNPDISPDAGASLQARTAGLSYNDFIQKIVSLALEKD